MIKIAICDDERIFVDKLLSNLKCIFDDMPVDVSFSCFLSATALIREYNTAHFDVIFLDIDMPHVDGFSVAESIRKISLNTLIIFVTSKHDLVYNSFEYQPFYFICKSNQEKLYFDLSHVSKKILAYFKQKKKIEVLDSVAGSVFVSISEIMYIKSEKHYLLYYLNNGDEIPLKERAVLSSKKDELMQLDFLNTHQRYLINMNYISRFDSMINSITMKNGEQIPISKRLRTTAFEAYKKFKRR